MWRFGREEGATALGGAADVAARRHRNFECRFGRCCAAKRSWQRRRRRASGHRCIRQPAVNGGAHGVH